MRALEPALVLATHQPLGCPAIPGAVVLPVEAQCWQHLQSGELLRRLDASGRSRVFRVEAADDWGLRLRVDQGCRLVAGLWFVGDEQRQLVVAPLPP